MIECAAVSKKSIRSHGDAYRDYQARVPGYPVIGFGPLGRRAMPVRQPEPVLASD
jgi:hypothetical protein